ncbi:MAG: serine hydrolase [Gemmatimonadales bacterium]|nr:serine hydrolase [Gemmatimonadales bacterium]NIN12102.1 serine hydrolase [Gemmatimonadales bacterium]NIR03337.1 serine hydrolase [Gemmatimonadales bacterium]NIS67017.1 serine hydrolase [Gemmatimonadales bacterium]
MAAVVTVVPFAPAAAQQGDLEARVDSIFARYDHTRSPGCALGVIRDGAFVLKRGYGMANLEYGIALTPTSVFRIGSTSKQFTAAAILLLAEEGKLSLDDNVRRYVPELRERYPPVTIRHLLHHTSGVRDYLTLMTLAGRQSDDFYTDDDVVGMLARQNELNFAPGEEYLYSNSGYFLLSRVVRGASGKSLRQYADEKIFRPLAMTHTHFHDDHREVVSNRASGYAPVQGGGFRISMTNLDMVGDGGVFTTVEDLLRWDRHFYRRQIGGERFWHEMLERGVLNSGDTLDYARGLVHGEYRGLKTVSHGGAFVGFRAQLLRFPEQRFSVICLCNLSSANPSRLALRVADVYLEDLLGPAEEEETPERRQDEPQEAEPFHLSGSQRAQYVGDYYSEELDVVYQIRVEDDTLRLTVGNFLDGALQPVAPDTLERRFLTLRFQRDRNNGVTGFLLDAGRVKNLRFTRRPSD